MLVRPVRCAPQPAAGFGGQQHAALAAFTSLHPEPRRAKLPGPLGCKEQHLAQNAEGERQPHARHRRRVFPAKTGGASCLQSSDSPRPSIRLIHALDYSKALKFRPSLSMIHIDAHPLRNS